MGRTTDSPTLGQITHYNGECNPNDKVLVKVPNKDCWCSGTIKKCNDDGTYKVALDELEKNADFKHNFESFVEFFGFTGKSEKLNGTKGVITGLKWEGDNKWIVKFIHPDDNSGNRWAYNRYKYLAFNQSNLVSSHDFRRDEIEL